jgi:hypothetical protein
MKMGSGYIDQFFSDIKTAYTFVNKEEDKPYGSAKSVKTH